MATGGRASTAAGARRHSPVVPVRVEPHRCTALEKRRLLGTTPFFSVAALLAGVLAGHVDMAGGMLVHQGSVLVVILNAMRLLRGRAPTQQPRLAQALQ